MQNNVLPCPFCGGEAKYIEDKDFFISRFVTCTKCGIETRRNYLRKDLAIKDWNTRKPMERIVKQLEKRENYLAVAMQESHKNGYTFSEEKAMNERVAIKYAIKIVKGGVDNAE